MVTQSVQLGNEEEEKEGEEEKEKKKKGEQEAEENEGKEDVNIIQAPLSAGFPWGFLLSC